MKTAVFSVHNYEKDYLLLANSGKHQLNLLEEHLSDDTVNLAIGCKAVSLFVSDDASAPVLKKLHAIGVQFIVLRSAGFDNVDIEAAHKLKMKVARVPSYSPYAVAEHAVALMLTLNRQLISAHLRIVEQNFCLDDLEGFDMNGKTVGIIGTGKIGSIVAKIMLGFGCKILASDPYPNPELKKQSGIIYTDCDTLCREADIITLHAPLTKESEYLVDKKRISLMKKGVMLINTARGKLVNTMDVIDALRSGKIGYFGMDVYENEGGLFFENHSGDILQDDIFMRLTTFKNVLITGHQAFLTDTALSNIAASTVYNLDCFENGTATENEIK